MTLLPRRWFAALTTALACLAAATSGFAQQGWTGVVTDLPHGLGFGAMAADGTGNVRLVWSEEAGDGIHSVVRTTRRSAATGEWSPPVDVYSTSAAPGVVCGQLVVDAGGNATASCAEGSHPAGARFVLRYRVTNDTWTPEQLEAGAGSQRAYLAMDGAGNTYAIWSSATLRIRRHTAATDSWSPVVELPVVGIAPRIAADARGDLFLMWRTYDDEQRITVHAAHYEAATGRWQLPAGIPLPSFALDAEQVAVDQAGHGIVLWAQPTVAGASSVVRAARYDASTGAFGPAVPLSGTGAEFSEPRLLMDAGGNALAVWRARYSGSMRIEASAYLAHAGAWSGVAAVSASASVVSGPEIAGDGVGNATIAWYSASAAASVLQTARLPKGAGALGAPVDVAEVATDTFNTHPWIAADRLGSTTVLWRQALGALTVQTTRWEAAPAAPAIVSAVAAGGALRVHGTPPATSEPDFLPTNYEYSVDDGLTWTARTPASTTSPIEIRGLAGGATYQLRVRAVNRAGAGAASAPVAAVLGAAPEAPVDFAVAAIAGNRVTVRWGAPTGPTLPEGYVLEGGLEPGGVLAALPTGGTAPTFTFTAPTGAFYVRLRAYAGASWSGPSNELLLHVNVAVPPSAPASLLAVVDGSTLALSWTNTLDGGAPTSLWLYVEGAAEGVLPLPMGEAFTVAGVPPGTYTLRVRAANAAGVSPPSNAVTVTIPAPCTGVPEPPRNFVAVAAGRTIHAAWDAPASGAAVAGYTLLVTGAHAGSFSTSGRSLSGTAAPGSYTLSVVATNACGTSAATPTRTVTVVE